MAVGFWIGHAIYSLLGVLSLGSGILDNTEDVALGYFPRWGILGPR